MQSMNRMAFQSLERYMRRARIDRSRHTPHGEHRHVREPEKGIQSFEESCYFDEFVPQLRENEIDYDVLYYDEACYPQVKFPLVMDSSPAIQ